jgi:hypothetical protein
MFQPWFSGAARASATLPICVHMCSVQTVLATYDPRLAMWKGVAFPTTFRCGSKNSAAGGTKTEPLEPSRLRQFP